MPVIDLTDVHFSWSEDEASVLDMPAFTVNQGECVFVSGPSGSGKTTLLNVLGGVLVPQTGSVSVLETDLKTLSGAKRDSFRADHIGFIFQMFNLVPYLSLVENVVLPCRFSASRKAKAIAKSSTLEAEAHRILEHLGLGSEGLLGREVSRLSIGQQQRVAAARALIGAPELIIADEPTSSLDADSRGAFLDLLFAEVKAANATLVFVSHDASLQQHFDRTVSLQEINLAKPCAGCVENDGGMA